MKSEFPGFAECLRLMKVHDPQLNEDGFHALLPHAHEHLPELISAFRREEDHGLQCWLLELIGEARSPEALPVLLDYLGSSDESLQFWAVWGLRELGTKDARRALWEAGLTRD